jgi:hypothetical protein
LKPFRSVPAMRPLMVAARKGGESISASGLWCPARNGVVNLDILGHHMVDRHIVQNNVTDHDFAIAEFRQRPDTNHDEPGVKLRKDKRYCSLMIALALTPGGARVTKETRTSSGSLWCRSTPRHQIRMSRKGGERAYNRHLGKDRSPHHSRHSFGRAKIGCTAQSNFGQFEITVAQVCDSRGLARLSAWRLLANCLLLLHREAAAPRRAPSGVQGALAPPDRMPTLPTVQSAIFEYAIVSPVLGRMPNPKTGPSPL